MDHFKGIKVRHLIFASFLTFLLASCGQNKDELGIKLIGSNTNLFGYANSTYIIGDTIDIHKIDTSGIYIKVDQSKLEGITINKNSIYELSNGLRVGSSKNVIRSIMGQPMKDGIAINKPSLQISTIDALIYKNLIFFLDENKKAKQIVFGKTQIN